MIEKDFLEMLKQGLPSPEDLVFFIRAVGWKLVLLPDGSPGLAAHEESSVSRAVARLLACEPLRGDVLALKFSRAAEARPAPEPVEEWKPVPAGWP